MKTPSELEEIINANMGSLVEFAPCAFVITAPDGLLLRANHIFFDWLGQSQEELIKKVRFQDLLSIGSKIYYETHYAPLLVMQGELSEITVDFKGKDKSSVPVLVNTKAFKDEDGGTLFYKSTLFNISERRQYEKELVKARVKAEKESARIKFLLKAGEEIKKYEDYRKSLDLVANHAIQNFCDAFAIDFFQDGNLQRVSEAHAVQNKQVPPIVMTPELNQPLIVRDDNSDVPKFLEDIVSNFEPQSIVIVPIIKNSKIVGVISAWITEFGRRFDEEDLDVLIDLSKRISSAHDIFQLQSVNKQVSQEIKHAKGWLNTTLSYIGDGVIGTEVDGSISFFNETAEKLTGWTSKEAFGKDIFEVLDIKFDDASSMRAIVEQVIIEKIAGKLFKNTILRSRSGQLTLIEHRTSPIIDTSGNLLGVVIIFRDVSEEYERNKTLLEERARFEAVLHQMPEGVMIVEPSGTIILKNVQVDKLLASFPVTENVSLFNQFKGFKTTGESYLAHEWPLARSLMKGEVVINEEIYLFDKFQNRITLSVSSSPIKNDEGGVLAGVIILHDISSTKKTEAELRYQLNLTKVITDNAASALFMMDKEGKPTFMNPAAQKITEYSSLAEISEKPLHYAVHWKKPDGSHYPMEECPIDNAQAELKKVQNQEEIFCSKSGKLFPVSYSVSPLEKDGEIIGSVLEFRDITEQKEAERKLHLAIIERDKSLETLKTVNRVGQRLTAELNLDTLVQQVTDDATHLTGAQFGAFFYNSVDNEGRSVLLNVVSGLTEEESTKFLKLQSNEVFNLIFAGEGTVRSGDITKDSRYSKNFPYNGIFTDHLPVRSYLAVSVVSRSGEVIGGLFFGHSSESVFTEQAEKIVEGLAAQAAVAMDNARLYRKIQESVKARDEFLSIASHELKTPLTSLKLQTQMRNRKLSKGELSTFNVQFLKKMFETDARQIERISRLIDDMLDISRINTGKLNLQIDTFDINVLVKDVLDRYSSQINDYHSSVDLHCTEEIIGCWDRFRIEQVVTNLLTNALRYGNQKPVNIYLKADNKMASIIFQDRGLGIAKENQKRIFERFERAVSANEVSGLGLGLYIVKEIIEMHGGSIEVESEIGHGSKFIVQLPLNKGS